MRTIWSLMAIFCLLASDRILAQLQASGMPPYITWLNRTSLNGKNAILWGAVKGSDLEVRVQWDFEGDGQYDGDFQTVPAQKLNNGHRYFEAYYHYAMGRKYFPRVKVQEKRGNNWQEVAVLKLEMFVSWSDDRVSKLKATILDGLRFLYKTQNNLGTWDCNEYPEACGFMMLAFENQNFLPCMNFTDSPFADTVKMGLNYLEGVLKKRSLPSDYDINVTNNSGYYIVKNAWPFHGYTLPVVALAFIGARDRLRVAQNGDTRGETYERIVGDIVDFLLWAQRRDNGGWGYCASGCGVADYERADSSISHWAPTTFIYAQQVYGTKTNTASRTLLAKWIQNVQELDNKNALHWGDAGYDGRSWRSPGMTGGLLFCIHYIDPKVRYRQSNEELYQRLNAALTAIGRRWDTMIRAHGSYDYYSISKGLKTLDPQIHYLHNGQRDIDWFWELANAIIELNTSNSGQLSDVLLAGFEKNPSNPGTPWITNAWVPTAINVLTLQPYVLAYPPVAEAGQPMHVVQGSIFTLDASASWHPLHEEGRKIISYNWDINNDGLFNEVVPNTSPFLVISPYARGTVLDKPLSEYFDTKGKYQVHLEVTDDQGKVSNDTVLVFVEDRGGHLPLPIIEGDHMQNGILYELTGKEMTFSCSNQVQDPDIDPALPADHANNIQERLSSYEWDVDGDGQFDGTTEVITRTFSQEIEGWVSLRVKNKKGEQGIAYRRFHVQENKAPIVERIETWPILGSLPIAVQKDLNQGQITSQLRQELAKIGVQLADTVTAVEIKKTERQWQITDTTRQRKYWIVKDEPIFSVDTAFSTGLDQCKIDENLHKEFEDQDHSLSELVQVIKKGEHWAMYDRRSKKEYMLVQEQNTIQVYQGVNCLNVFVLSVECREGMRTLVRVYGKDLNSFQSPQVQCVFNAEDRGTDWLYAQDEFCVFEIIPPDNGTYNLTIVAMDQANSELKTRTTAAVKAVNTAPKVDLLVIKNENRYVMLVGQVEDMGQSDGPFSYEWQIQNVEYVLDCNFNEKYSCNYEILRYNFTTSK